MATLAPGAPLVSHLFTVLRDPEQHLPNADGLRYVTDDDTLQRVMRGLSARFLRGAPTAPRPKDCASIVVVLVGGVTFAEVRAIRDAWQPSASDPGVAGLPPVLVVSNALTGPDHMYSHVIGPASTVAAAAAGSRR